MSMKSDAETRGVAQIPSRICQRADHQIRDFVEDAREKGVWGHSSEAELLQLVCRKVTQVPRENVRCVGGDSGCDDMTIIWIWKRYPRNVLLVPADRGGR